jgi:ATP-dependent Clp protease protease subunit
LLLLLPALAIAAAPAVSRAAEVAAADLPDEVQRQIEEQTKHLPDDIRDKVRDAMVAAVNKHLEKQKSDEKEDNDDESAADKKEKSAEKGKSAKKDEKATDEPATDPVSAEAKKLREEMELLETRFKHRLAKYEQDHESERFEVAKAKLARRLKSEKSAEDLADAQEELERLKIEADLQKKRAEIDQLKSEAELAAARTEKAKIEQSFEVEDIKEKLDERVLGEENYPDEPFKDGVLSISLRRIELNGPIYDGAADYVCQRLDYLNNQSHKPIFLVIDECPGGSAIEGFQIVQAIKNSKAPVHVVIKRMAASMAAIIATLSDHSYCYPDSIILHHQASTLLMGNGRDMEDQMRQFKAISSRLIGAVAKKLGQTEQEFVDEMYKNRVSGDWDLFGDEAVKKGWIEHVATTIREEGIRTRPKGMRDAQRNIIILGESDSASPTSAAAASSANGYLERYEVTLSEEVDREGRRFVRLPRISPMDAWLIYNPDGYYR